MHSVMFNLSDVFNLRELSLPFQKFKVLVPPEVEVGYNDINYPSLGEKQNWNNFINREVLKEMGWEEKNLSVTNVLRDLYNIGEYSYGNSVKALRRFILQHGPIWNCENRNFIYPAFKIEEYIITAQIFYKTALMTLIEASTKKTEDHNLISNKIFSELRNLPDLGNNDYRDVNELADAIIDRNINSPIEKSADRLSFDISLNEKSSVWKFKNDYGFVIPAWFLLVKLLSQPNKIDICDECQVIYFRKIRPKTGQLSFCPKCGKKGLLSKRKWWNENRSKSSRKK